MKIAFSLPARLCLVTPWPPQHTGIADYAYDLAKGLLEEGCELTVVTEAASPKELPGVSFQKPDFLCDTTVAHFDSVIYQLGNNSSFHIFQLPLLASHPGVIHLHDLVLHHLMAWILHLKGSPTLYRSTLAKWYGPRIAGWASEASHLGRQIWNTPAVMHTPFFEEAVQHATGLITNSRFSANRVQASFPALPCLSIPQLYREVIPHRGSSDGDFHIGMLGGIDPHKRIDLVWQAVSALMTQGIKLQLHLAGSINAQSRPLIDQMLNSPHADRVHVHGRVDDLRFISLLSELDLVTALRFPSMGETSAVVMRALQAGTPTIVNDIAWYSELPPFVKKIVPDQPEELEQLTQLIKTLATRDLQYIQIKHASRAWADTELHFKTVANNYAAFCMENSAR